MFSKRNLLQYANYLVFSLVIIGIGLAAYGGYLYYDNSKKLDDLEEREKLISQAVQGTTPGVSNPAAEGLFYSSIAIRRDRNAANDGRDTGIRFGGAGIICVAAAWLVRDFSTSYRRRMERNPTSPAAG